MVGVGGGGDVREDGAVEGDAGGEVEGEEVGEVEGGVYADGGEGGGGVEACALGGGEEVELWEGG